MSTVTVSAGSAWNSGQVQLTGDSAPSIENVQCASGVGGVGPADRTGKACVTYWPGGTRPAGSASSWRRRKTPEMGLIGADYAAVTSRQTLRRPISAANKPARTT